MKISCTSILRKRTRINETEIDTNNIVISVGKQNDSEELPTKSDTVFAKAGKNSE